MRPLLERFMSKVQRGGEDDCWPWLGYRVVGGYGRFSLNGRPEPAHRVAYELFVGPIPKGYDVDHDCHNRDRSCAGGPSCPHRACVNPRHLLAATRSDNLRRSGHMGRGPNSSGAQAQRAKTHCPQGHPYSPENTYRLPSRPTARYCRKCHRLHTRTRRERARV